MKRTPSLHGLARAASNHLFALAVLFLALPASLPAQTLQHRYSFTADASDSVGTANGTLVGSAAIVGNAVSLPGGGTSGNATGISYVSLPNGIVSSDTSVTVECWMTDTAGGTWAEAWCFGDSTAGPGNPPGNGTYYFGFIPHSGGNNMRVAFNNSISEVDIQGPANSPLPLNVEQYVVVTYDAPSTTARLYVNGVQVGSQTVPVDHAPSVMGSTYNDWLGRDQFGGDAMFAGSLDELRIWNAAVTPLYIVASTAAGPDNLLTNLTPTAVNVTVTNLNMVGAQTQQASAAANFVQVSGVAIPGTIPVWKSSNTNVLTINASGLITAVNGGNATVTATINGTVGTSASITVALTSPGIVQQPVPVTAFVGQTATFSVGAVGGQLSYQWSLGVSPISGATNSSLVLANLTLAQAGTYSVTVSNALGHTNSNPVLLTVLPPTLQHRWSFNTDLNDSIAGANGTLFGSAFLDGVGNVQFPNEGTTSDSAGATYVGLPDGLMTNCVSMTVEVWTTDNGPETWAEVWSFGGSTNGVNNNDNQTNYVGLITHSGANGGDFRAAFKTQGEQDIFNPTPMPTGVEQYVVLTYDAPSTTASLYLNGVQVATSTNITITPASLGDTFNNYIGRDQFNDANYVGSVDELRIWNAAVSPLYQVLTLIAGPDVIITNTTPSLLTVTVTNTTMVGGQTQQATVTGNFPQESNVSIPGNIPAWSSSNPNVVTVNNTGLVTAVGSGTATVSATISGVTAPSATITVSVTVPVINQAPQPLTRYVGQSATFTVSAVGGQLTYQWSKGAAAIAGATNTSLTLHNLGLADSANYSITVSNAAGHVSASAALTVIEPTLIHRYTFDTDASDLIGGANGTLMGSAFISNNAVQLPDTNSTSQTAGASYVALPNGLLTNLNSVTFEVWATDNAGRAWAEIFSFGGSTDGVNNDSDGTNYIAFIPTTAFGDMRGAFRLLNEQDVVWLAHTLPLNQEQDIVLSYDDQSTTATLYLNGVMVAVNTNLTITPAQLGNSYNNYLGRDQFAGDPIFQGSIDEFRIYAGALSPTDIANNDLMGPEKVVAPGTLFVPLTVTHSGSNAQLTWSAGTLQQAPSLSGPWTAVPGATSPYVYTGASKVQFFRVHP